MLVNKDAREECISLTYPPRSCYLGQWVAYVNECGSTCNSPPTTAFVTCKRSRIKVQAGLPHPSMIPSNRFRLHTDDIACQNLKKNKKTNQILTILTLQGGLGVEPSTPNYMGGKNTIHIGV